MQKEKTQVTISEGTINVSNYGEVLAQVNNLDLVSFEEDGGYQGNYCAVLSDDERLFYYVDSYGSCSGCDWLEDARIDGTDEIPYKEALDYCQDLKPKFVVPKNMPLEVTSLGEYEGFSLEGYKPKDHG